MPVAAARPCRHHGCSRLVTDGSGYCAAHQSDRKVGKFADERRGSRQSRGYGAEWDKLRPAIIKRDLGLCQSCYRKNIVRPGRIVDHIVPKFEGGTDDPSNLELICDECSAIKTQAEAKRARHGGASNL